MKKSLLRHRWAVLGLCAFLAAAAASPEFLKFTEDPIHADAAVVMLGPGYSERLRAAQSLVELGAARFLIIPAYGIVLLRGEDGGLQRKFSAAQGAAGPCHPFPFRVPEATHLELLKARAILEQFGFRSANLVSSPFHMRRVKVIADRVFSGSDIRYACTPAGSLEPSPGDETQAIEPWRWVATEYAKLAWFIIYSQFVSLC
jgi:hypothetical protein